MMSNGALPFPDEEMVKRYLISSNHVEVPVQELASGENHRLKEEKRLIMLRFADVNQAVCVTAATIDMLNEVCMLKLRNIIVASAQNRMGEDLVKDMQSIMPQKTSSVDRILRILSHSESEIPLYFVNLANRLAAYFTIDKDKKGMITLIQAARIIESFKGYEAWLESEKNNRDKLRENALKLLNMMADYPALLNRENIIQKVVKGSAGLEVMASVLSPAEVEQVVQDMLAEFTVFQNDERELLTNPQAIINAFHVVSRHPVSSSLQELYFFVNNRVIFKPLHMLLELDRREIYQRVRAELPFLYRYPFLRWLASVFGLIGTSQPAPEEKPEPSTEKSTTVLKNTDWHRILHMVETRLIGEKNALEMIRKYGDLWNIKLGDAHKQLEERVDKEIALRAKRLFSMTRKLPEITQSFLSNEIGNAATQIVRKFGNDAADTRALNQYIQLSLIEQLKSIHN
jgi:hypothetical protein